MALCLNEVQGFGVMEFILFKIFKAENLLAAPVHLMVELIQEVRGSSFMVEIHLVVWENWRIEQHVRSRIHWVRAACCGAWVLIGMGLTVIIQVEQLHWLSDLELVLLNMSEVFEGLLRSVHEWRGSPGLWFMTLDRGYQNLQWIIIRFWWWCNFENGQGSLGIPDFASLTLRFLRFRGVLAINMVSQLVFAIVRSITVWTLVIPKVLIKPKWLTFSLCVSFHGHFYFRWRRRSSNKLNTHKA
jgi:hypothetical protein